MQDQMSPAERAAALTKGLEVDRLPCNPNIANGVSRIYGCKISEFNWNAKILAEAQIASYRKFGYDSIRIFTDLFAWAEAMGATVHFPEDDTADLEASAIVDIQAISTLHPADPYHDGRLPVYLEAMKYLVDQVGDEISCSAGIVGPFTNAFFLLGMDESLKCIHKNPEAIHKLCQVSLETVIAYADAAIKLGLTPTISEPMSSSDVISPKVFREFSLPYLKATIDFVKSKGKNVVVHVCGQTEKIWQDIASIGIGGMSIDNIASLKACCNTIGKQTKILGNVDPGGVMYFAGPKEVRKNTLTCIRDGYNSPKGYVVMSGCSLPIETPFANIQAMMDTVREVGYPVDLEKVGAMLAACD